MAISISNYVDITSGVGAGAAVPSRDLVLRVFTGSNYVPPQNFVSFTNPTQVGAYFGLLSEEYFRSVFYFGWISKNLTSPGSLQYARWVTAATAPMIFAFDGNNSQPANWQTTTSGSFVLTMGGFTFSVSSLNFTSVVTLLDVATVIQTGIRAQTGGGTQWTMATVTYDASSGGFDLVGGVTGDTHPISVSIGGGGTDITGAGFLGWLPQQIIVNGAIVQQGAVFNIGSAAESITQTLTASSALSNNFGSFLFLNNLNLTLPQVVQAATWNNATQQNLLYMYNQAVTAANAATWAADSGGVGLIGGVQLTISGLNFVEVGTTAPTTFAQTGTLVATMDTVTGLASTTQMFIGMPISDGGVNIPVSTTVASIVSSTSITMSHSATGSATESITFTLGNYTVTNLVDTSQMVVGMPVSDGGNHIPANTVISAIITPSMGATTGTILLSNAADTVISEPLTFTLLQFPEQMPAMIEAATNYLAANSVQNYEFQQFPGVTPSVTTDAQQEALDGIFVNYYGATQQAGSLIAFYQRGVMMGLPVNPSDQNVYANEIWLKDAATVAIMNLLLSLSQLPANNQGRNQLLTILQGVINQALNNGTISVGKTLTVAQQTYITSATGDPLAWYQVQNSGYWVDVVITASGSPLEYTATYTLIYSKDDVIRQVIGTHTLI